jgi:hypothetical protein
MRIPAGGAETFGRWLTASSSPFADCAVSSPLLLFVGGAGGGGGAPTDWQ